MVEYFDFQQEFCFIEWNPFQTESWNACWELSFYRWLSHRERTCLTMKGPPPRWSLTDRFPEQVYLLKQHLAPVSSALILVAQGTLLPKHVWDPQCAGPGPCALFQELGVNQVTDVEVLSAEPFQGGGGRWPLGESQPERSVLDPPPYKHPVCTVAHVSFTGWKGKRAQLESPHPKPTVHVLWDLPLQDWGV